MAENGGAYAIKGFNFQKACILYIILENYLKTDFSIIPESKEDFDVSIGIKKYYVQVKSKKNYSLNQLIKRDENELSVLEKNLSHGNINDSRKFAFSSITNAFFNGLIETNGELLPRVLQYSDSQITDVVSQLELNQENKSRLKNQRIIIMPFQDNLTSAYTYLLGKMVENNININDCRKIYTLNSLSIKIDQKSELPVTKDEDISYKKICGEYLKELFKSTEENESFEEYLDEFDYTYLKKRKILLKKLNIIHEQSHNMNIIRDKVKIENLLQFENDKLVIDYLVGKVKEIDEYLLDTDMILAMAHYYHFSLGREMI
ncbi:dsDNA nuclease domain-containing protein [Facklamia lactis]|uniref:dsDNA nuclease domain-containing protein n=1 Tax=Facklamia lactis TaxID=2749967 RepID=UPI0018CF5326|nr:dsDNA nuclease domain-containing protein [Facklamia lactis]MBG9979434.1 DUF4297 domain-containing protein [Facklamia lactis]